jgi:hypothetical protein
MGAAADVPPHLSPLFPEQSNSASAAFSSTGQDLLTSAGAGQSQSKTAAAKSGKLQITRQYLLNFFRLHRIIFACVVKLKPLAAYKKSKGSKQGWNRN